MPKYTVYAKVERTYAIDVEADNEEDAIEKAEVPGDPHAEASDCDTDDWEVVERPDDQAVAPRGFV